MVPHQGYALDLLGAYSALQTPCRCLRRKKQTQSGTQKRWFDKVLGKTPALTRRGKKTVKRKRITGKQEAEDISGFVMMDKTTITPKYSYPIIQQITERNCSHINSITNSK